MQYYKVNSDGSRANIVMNHVASLVDSHCESSCVQQDGVGPLHPA